MPSVLWGRPAASASSAAAICLIERGSAARQTRCESLGSRIARPGMRRSRRHDGLGPMMRRGAGREPDPVMLIEVQAPPPRRPAAVPAWSRRHRAALPGAAFKLCHSLGPHRPSAAGASAQCMLVESARARSPRLERSRQGCHARAAAFKVRGSRRRRHRHAPHPALFARPARSAIGSKGAKGCWGGNDDGDGLGHPSAPPWAATSARRPAPMGTRRASCPALARAVEGELRGIRQHVVRGG